MRIPRLHQGYGEIIQRHTDQLKQENYHLLVAGKLYFSYQLSGNNDVYTITNDHSTLFFLVKEKVVLEKVVL